MDIDGSPPTTTLSFDRYVGWYDIIYLKSCKHYNSVDFPNELVFVWKEEMGYLSSHYHEHITMHGFDRNARKLSGLDFI